jgi:hypothetical protein
LETHGMLFLIGFAEMIFAESPQQPTLTIRRLNTTNLYNKSTRGAMLKPLGLPRCLRALR